MLFSLMLAAALLYLIWQAQALRYTLSFRAEAVANAFPRQFLMAVIVLIAERVIKLTI